MKSYIIGVAMFIVFMIFTVFQYDYNLHQQYLYNLKFAAQEAAAAGSQYWSKAEFAEGRFIFNQTEGKKAAEYIIRQQLKLDEFLQPLSGSYWQEKVTYTMEFFDDSNSNFPFLYENADHLFTITIAEPSVVITINAGKPRYRLIENPPDAVRVAAHEWKER